MSFSPMNQIESRSAAVLLFFIGVFSQTQVSIGGKLGVSEFAMVLCAPVVFFRSIGTLRKDKVLYFFIALLAWLGGALLVDYSIHNYIPFMLRGIAVPITVFCNSVCIYALLKKNYGNLKWFLLGSAISSVISIFFLQGGLAGDVAAEQGVEAGVEAVVGYKLFWVNKLTTWLTLPIVGWFLFVPKTYSVLALAFICIFDLAAGARASFMAAAFSLTLVIVGGKTRATILRIRRHIVIMAVSAVVLMAVAKGAYEYAVAHGYMNEYEAKKFERQTSQGTSALKLLMAGRSEFFIGLIAALDKPVLGHGSVAIDDNGYVLDYLSKYGDYDEYLRLIRGQQEVGTCLIPVHSHVITYWLWHGMFALLFWLIVLYLAVKTLVVRMHVYPEWFGFYAISLPIFFWDYMFSPFGMRVFKCTLFVTLLLVSKLARDQKRGVVPLN